MPIGEWFHRPRKFETSNTAEPKRAVPDGVWEQCKGCNEALFIKEWESNYKVCPKCGYHAQLFAYERIQLLADPNSFEELWADMRAEDPLSFITEKPYADSLTLSRTKTGLNDAVACGKIKIEGHKAAVAVMDFRFIGGSMGSVVGEKIAKIVEIATEEYLPLIIISSSGGARMQEGMFSLMQMAKTSAAIARHFDKGLPYISILSNPTSGGVTASFAMLGDIIIAEPGAFIGFTGPRVIEQTIKQKLPKGFQTAESNMEHGMIDMIVSRPEIKHTLARLIDYLGGCGVELK
jgi:acetyl-CoA carboxylase carboxyl transferase subunit beta